MSGDFSKIFLGAAVWAAVSAFFFGSFQTFGGQGPGSLGTPGNPLRNWRVPAAARERGGKGSHQAVGPSKL